MKQTILFTLVTLLLISPLGLHAAGWIEQDSGSIQGYQGITYSNGNVVAVGNTGYSTYSNDDGETWVVAEKISSSWWRDVVTNHDGNAVAVGDSGTYAISSDGGVTWNSSSLGSTANFYSIDMSDSNGYIAGNEGTLLYYNSSANHWYVGSTGVTEDLYVVQDLGDGTGWIGGASGRLLKISSGGVSFANIGRVSTDAIRGLYFTTSGTGWIVGDNGMFKKTTDSGSSWSNVSVSTLEYQDLHDIQVTGDNMVVVGDEIVLISVDGGDSWTAESFDDDNKTFYAAYYGSESELWIAGTDFDVYSSVYRYDGTAPGVPSNLTINEDTPTPESELTLSWDPSEDAESEIEAYYVSIDGSDAEAIGTGLTYELGIFEVGEHTVSLYAVDTEGNSGDAAELVFTVSDSSEGEDVVESEAEVSNLIKMTCSAESPDVNDPCRAVYYYAADGYRHAFPNESVFYTWFDDFDDVIEVSSEFLSSLRLGSNVTYHPGTKMVKFQSVPTVYAVAAGGELRAIASEEVAEALYGSDWNQQINDIADAFFGNYTFGDDISVATDYDVEEAGGSVTTLDENF